MSVVMRVVRAATTAAMTISCVILSVVTLLLVANVIFRFFGIQILGLYEILTALTVVMLSLCLADSQREKQHVAITLLTERLSRRTQDALNVLTTTLSVVITAVIAIALMRYTAFHIENATSSELLKLPTWLTLTALIVGVVLLVFTLLVDDSRAAIALKTGVQHEEIW